MPPTCATTPRSRPPLPALKPRSVRSTSLSPVPPEIAFVPQAYQVHVGAAKAGIDNLMKNLAVEWGKHGIRANSIVPGPIEGTEGMRRLSTPENNRRNKEVIPLRRYGQ